ncbi:MAG: cytochrome c biogenesis protein CcdA, partial [Thermodesulfovibrionales bacterium]
MRTLTWFSVLICLATFTASPAIAITPAEILEVKPYLGSDKIPAGGAFKLAVEMKLLRDWHINSNVPTSEFAIPTALVFDELPGITLTRITYPTAKVEVIEKLNTTIDYYDGTSYVIIEGRASPDISPGTHTLRGTLTYQGCKGRECLLPAKKEVRFSLKVVPEGTPVSELNPQIFTPAGLQAGTEPPKEEGEGKVSQMISEKGLLLTLILIFLGGLALNLTPCVYPLIPITISYFGGLEQRGKRLINATAYVLGLALTYSALGTFAALSGGMLGKQLTNPAVTVVIAGVLVALSLSMFGLYEIRVPSFVMRLVGGEAKSGAAGSLVMGCTMGIIAAPCIGPF